MTEQLSFDLDALVRPAEPFDPGGSSDQRDARPGEPLSATRIAELLGRPCPTSEQIAVIEAPLAPLLVVAGAGSGKTETMAARVVWLVANALVSPDQVLGLTFTRKAAAELADRVRLRLNALQRKGPQHPGASGPTSTSTPVTVSTYHAYAASVLADHGLRLGLETGSRLISEAAAWQLVDELVEGWDGEMGGVDAARSSVVDAVLSLAAECAEHLVDVTDADAVVAGLLERVIALPAERGGAAPVRTVIAKLAAKRRLLPLVEAYLRRKRELEVLDFGDQVALAARVAGQVPEVGLAARAQFAVVLLDEYQDTSHAQLDMLQHLFGDGHPVTAVGDPHQSIYGWRGASAGNLQRFPTDFPLAGGGPAPVSHLATSWRNDRGVLAAANLLAAPLLTAPAWAPNAPRVPVPPLRARPDAGAGRVALAWYATVEEEATAVAEAAQSAWQAGDSVAVLCRARSQFPLLEAALRARDLPVEVVGLGGLLHVPEVADLRAALEVVHDPSRGDSLARLLLGPGPRLGPRDLDALGAWARDRWRQVWQGSARLDGAARDSRPDAGLDIGLDPVLDEVDEASLVEALDDLPGQEWVSSSGQRLSAAGRQRLTALASVLRHLRSRTALSLPELVAEVERSLLLDIEVAVSGGRRPAAARAALDAFIDVAAAFADSGSDRSSAGLGAFLAWLSAAEAEERGLEAPVAQVQPGAVQLLTVHAAKGLEWDVVAVPGLVEGTFPVGHAGRSPSGGGGWLTTLGALPYPVRGDAAGLPSWRVGAAGTQRELAAALEDFRADCGAHDVAEERRLAYVALTRARRTLLLSGAMWGEGSRPRAPSRFLDELFQQAAAQGFDVPAWEPPPDGEVGNPREARTRAVDWPLDPLAERRPALESAAALVREAMQEWEHPPGPSGPAREWDHEVAALLAERDAGRSGGEPVALPRHLSASQMVALAADPVALAGALRRPMPRSPSPQSRRGSNFHAWLEQRFGAAALVDVDELPGSADQPVADHELAGLQDRFLASPWAEAIPHAVEVAVETPVLLPGGCPVMVRGRIDAVFRWTSTDRRDVMWDVVDWKTGAPPHDPEQAASLAVQLAVYRLAWAELAGVEPDRVGAAFFYAATGATVRPVDLLDGAGLAALIGQAVASGAIRAEPS